MIDIDFRQIAPRCGGKQEAFEEFCCQLARRKVPTGVTRLHGSGGDGGVECFLDLPDGSRVGWQAKYVFDIDSLLTQTTKSLNTALRIHPGLTRYIICFPFDLTGRTGRRGRSGVEKFEAWREEQVGKAANQGRMLEIEGWTATALRSLLMDFDPSGGIQTFFDETVLSFEWFASHLRAARAIAGPRYTPELNVRTGVARWFAAFGLTREWDRDLTGRLKGARKRQKRLSEAIAQTSRDPAWPEWPDSLREVATAALEAMTKALDACGNLELESSYDGHRRSMELLQEAVSDLSVLEAKLLVDLEERHGPGRVDSPGFRQYMAEYELTFPASNLDIARESHAALRDMYDWLRSPEGSLAFCRAFVLSGRWGVGKTLGVSVYRP